MLFGEGCEEVHVLRWTYGQEVKIKLQKKEDMIHRLLCNVPLTTRSNQLVIIMNLCELSFTCNSCIVHNKSNI